VASISPADRDRSAEPSGKEQVRQIDLPKLARGTLDSMPLVHRIFLENLGRYASRDADAETALRQWIVEGRQDPVVPFRPHRIIMHDTTFGPSIREASIRCSVST